MRNSLKTLAAGLGLALTLAACGGDETTEQATASAEVSSTTVAPANDGASSATADVLFGDTGLGQVLIGPDGRTLYGFTNDVDALSTCYGTCAEAWPPVIVSDDWVAGPGLDFGIFATTVREDGQRQLVAGRWPLYYFAGDATAGDVNGQGSGDVWFAVDLDGILIRDGAEAAAAEGQAEDGAGDEGTAAPAAGAAIVSTATTDLGDVLVDEAGLTLYGFLPDRDEGGPSCNDACADAWPPVIVDGPELPAGLDPEVFSVMERADGSHQLAAGIWPLYRFAGDAAPGDVNGQGSGDVWFAATPDGKLIGLPGASASADDEGASVDAGGVSVDTDDEGTDVTVDPGY